MLHQLITLHHNTTQLNNLQISTQMLNLDINQCHKLFQFTNQMLEEEI